jgi:hypothetical protein
VGDPQRIDASKLVWRPMEARTDARRTLCALVGRGAAAGPPLSFVPRLRVALRSNRSRPWQTPRKAFSNSSHRDDGPLAALVRIPDLRPGLAREYRRLEILQREIAELEPA